MNWVTAENVQELFATLAPGFIILLVRSQFSVYRSRSIQEQIVAYAIVSAAYFAVLNPIVELVGLNKAHLSVVRDLCVYAAFPILIGLTWALAAAHLSVDGVWSMLGLRTLHHTPNAWDYAFSVVKPDNYVIVTLTDGTQIAGKYGSGSFSSTDPSERDILISEVWECEHDEWKRPVAGKSILISGNNVQLVEFFYPNSSPERDNDE